MRLSNVILSFGLGVSNSNSLWFGSKIRRGIPSDRHKHTEVLRKPLMRASAADESSSQSSNKFAMGYTTLGDSLRVSKVCLGTMTWGEQTL